MTTAAEIIGLLNARTEFTTVDGLLIERDVSGWRMEAGKVLSLNPPVVKIHGRDDPVQPHMLLGAAPAVGDWVAVISVGRLMFVQKVTVL